MVPCGLPQDKSYGRPPFFRRASRRGSMKNYLKQLINTATSGLSTESFDRWYALRSLGHPTDENRNNSTLAVTASLFALLMIFLIALAQSRQSIDAYVKERPLIKIPDARALVWQLDGKGPVTRKDLATMPVPENVTLRIKLPAGLAAPLSGSESAPVLVFPVLNYKSATIRVNGQFTGRYLESERLMIPFPETPPADGMIEVEVTVQSLSPAVPPLMPDSSQDLSRAEQSMMVMPFSEYRDLNEFAAADKLGRGNYVGFVGRIIMAVFALVLFIFVDASPESLGLALFMGFEAAAMSLSFDWLPGIDKKLVSNFCYQMGDIFRVYFALQLARIAPKSTRWWFLAGVPLSILYGYIRSVEQRHGWLFPAEIPNIRDIVAGGIGLVVCLRAATILAGRRLPWRVTALAVAGIGFFEQIVDPIGHYLPTLSNHAVFVEIVDILQPIAAWLLAFSAFINISSLETRVKALSGSEVRAQSIEREMELGQTVQSTFLRVPAVPLPMMISCHHEAAVYVAGDMFFIDWSESSRQLTVILSDLTGHGVQAALKASATNVIAQTLWSGDRVIQERRRDRLLRFDQQVQSFLNRLGGVEEMNTMVGLEFNERERTMEIFRSNFPLPILLRHTGESKETGWAVAPVILPNRKPTRLPLEPGSFLLLATDGFLSTSQQTAHLVRYLKKNLAAGAPSETASDIKDLVLGFAGFKQSPLPDDRTLIVVGLSDQ
ncbi:hypothetical protein EBZ80_01715 [bacterium]|nr:hypothetical protein [bacterium]